MAPQRHPLFEILTEAAHGRPPVANGDLTILPALPGGRHCVVAFTAHRQHGQPEGILVVGRGMAERWEMAYEVAPRARGHGLGRRLAAAACSLVHDGEPVFAQVSPGNVASLRACLAAGYRPLASEV